MSWSFTSARAAALKRAQQASARARRKGRAIKARVKVAVGDAVTGVKTGIKAAKFLRSRGRSLKESATTGFRVAKIAAGARERRMKAAARKKPKNKGR